MIVKEAKEIVIKHIMLLIMVGGKVYYAATETRSTMKYYICSTTSKQFSVLSWDEY